MSSCRLIIIAQNYKSSNNYSTLQKQTVASWSETTRSTHVSTLPTASLWTATETHVRLPTSSAPSCEVCNEIDIDALARPAS